MSTAVTVDAVGSQMGCAALSQVDLRGLRERIGRGDVEIIGSHRRVQPGSLVHRELRSHAGSRRMVLNNVGFVTDGGPRWQLAAGTAVRVADGIALVTGPAGAFLVTIAATAPVLLAAETRPVAAGFGSTTDARVLTCWINAALPVRATTVWSRARDGSAEGEMS